MDTEKQSEFDRVFNEMEAPDYPSTCMDCGKAGTNASLEAHYCTITPQADALHEVTYEAVKNSELSDLVDGNRELDVKADQLHDEVVKFMEQWIEKEAAKLRTGE